MPTTPEVIQPYTKLSSNGSVAVQITISESEGFTVSGNTTTDNISGLWFSGFTEFSSEQLMINNPKVNRNIDFLFFL